LGSGLWIVSNGLWAVGSGQWAVGSETSIKKTAAEKREKRKEANLNVGKRN
jgi:hypothetical protein